LGNWVYVNREKHGHAASSAVLEGALNTHRLWPITAKLLIHIPDFPINLESFQFSRIPKQLRHLCFVAMGIN
jgi:hypothetical protein